MSKFSSSDIVAQFPIAPADMPKIATATTRPTYTTIEKFQEAINSQALAIPIISSTLGHLALVIPAYDYTSVNQNNPFVTPTNPGLTPNHGNAATQAQITETNRAFQVETNTYNVYLNTQTHLRNQIISSVPDKYICKLKHKITQYSNVTPLQLLTHLRTTYGQVTSDDLTANFNRMTAPWNPPTPIEVLFEQLKEGQEFANEGKETIQDSQLMRLAYDNIKATGLFNEQCRTWRNKPALLKTYANLITSFTDWDTDRRQNETTSGSAGYSANAVRDVVREEFSNMLAAQDIDQPSMTHTDIESLLSDTTSTQSSANPEEQANAVSMSEIKTLLQTMMSENNNNNNYRTNNRNRNSQPLVAQGHDDDGTPITYCWSHGVTQNLKHHSKGCKRKKEGHQDVATLFNRMGGSNERCKPARNYNNNNNNRNRNNNNITNH